MPCVIFLFYYTVVECDLPCLSRSVSVRGGVCKLLHGEHILLGRFTLLSPFLLVTVSLGLNRVMPFVSFVAFVQCPDLTPFFPISDLVAKLVPSSFSKRAGSVPLRQMYGYNRIHLL